MTNKYYGHDPSKWDFKSIHQFLNYAEQEFLNGEEERVIRRLVTKACQIEDEAYEFNRLMGIVNHLAEHGHLAHSGEEDKREFVEALGNALNATNHELRKRPKRD